MKLYATMETTYKGAKFGRTLEELKQKMDFADYTETALEILKNDGYMAAKIYINDLRRGKDITREQADELSKKIILSQEFDGIKTF